MPSLDREVLPVPSPYHHSRKRVLIAYMNLRREGATPWHAMQAVIVTLERRKPISNRDRAETEWDLFHARRYLKILDMRRPDFKWWCTL